MMINHYRFNRDDNSRIASYESLLDLFTLISFMLIFIAFIYMTKIHQASNNPLSVTVQDAVSGSGINQAFPKDMILLVIYKENSKDKIAILDGNTGEIEKSPITTTNIDQVLKKFSPKLSRTKKITITAFERNGPINYQIYFQIQEWLSKNRYNKLDIQFVGNP